MTALDTFIWGIFPYICLVVFIGGMAWRWKNDQFGWTSRSSQLHESKILRWGSPMFHVGILMVLAGHILGILVPKSWTQAVGISQEAYHLMATIPGAFAADSAPKAAWPNSAVETRTKAHKPAQRGFDVRFFIVAVL